MCGGDHPAQLLRLKLVMSVSNRSLKEVERTRNSRTDLTTTIITTQEADTCRRSVIEQASERMVTVT
jgi:hypothetical protein